MTEPGGKRSFSGRKGEPKTANKLEGQSNQKIPIIVGIGASAGGLEAFQALLPNLPAGADIAYVIVQHLDPSHPTMLGSLLQRFTSMPVKEIKDRERPEADHVYLTPPNRDATMSNGILHLSKPASAIGPKPSVDLFFTSLAEDRGDKAVGIILSGTGSDGAHGIRAIKAFGGITIVQDEKTARYNGMPRAAIETGHVDLVFPPEKIGQELLSVLKYPHLIPEVPAEEDRAPDDINKIFAMVAQRTGCDFSEYKINTINRRIGRRMALHKFSALQEYIHQLQKTPEEIDLLLKDILISVTSFFRDAEAFQALSKVLPRIVEKKQEGETIRVWVPGCSTGEEVYSIAILMAENLGESINKYTIQIFGTDLDQEAIERARKGVYPEATVVNVEKRILERYFIRKDNMVQVTDSVREMIVFARHDLIKDPPFAHLDLISCRNLLIYFNQNLQNRVVPLFHYVLNLNGLLFLGKSESINQYSDLFSPVSKRWRIFERRDVVKTPTVTLKYRQMPNFQFKSAKIARKPEMTLNDAMREAVLDAFGPPAVMIDDRLQIVCFRGDTSPFLRPPEGEVNLDILQMAKDNLRLDLRALVHRCSREGTAGVSRPLKVRVNGDEESVVIHVNPVGLAVAPKGTMLVAFESLKTYQYRERALTAPEGVDPRVFELEHELVETRERLQTTIEELETTNEELMSANEELQSANEELQSTNEELETTTEELQSTNEELNTVNDELQAKSGELSTANADLENILTQIGLPLVIVDRELRVKRYNLAATEIFSLVSGDIEQVITTVGSRLSLPNLREKLREVVRQNRTLDEDIEDGRRFYYLRIHPLLDKAGKAVGAMLIFVDKSRLIQTQRELEAIADISGVFLASGNLEEIYQKLPELISKQFNFPYVTVELHDEERGEMTVVGAAGLPMEKGRLSRTSLDDTICGEVIRSGAPVTINEESKRMPCRHPILGAIDLSTLLCMPLRLQDRTLGALVLADKLSRPDVTDIRGTLEVIAHHLALEIDRVHKTGALKQARDELERRVMERTAELENANRDLHGEILERTRTEEALRQSEARLAEANQIMAGVLEHTHMMAVLLDPQFNFVWVNRAYAATCNHDPSFFQGKNHFELYPHRENREIFQRVVDSGEPYSVAAKPFEFPDQPERGVTYWDWSLTPVKDDSGKVINLVFTLADVTERMRAQQARREIEERFHAFMDNSPAVAWAKDEQGRLVYLNSTYENRFGVRLEDWRGKTDSELWPPEIADQFRKNDQTVLATGQPIEITEVTPNPDGSRSTWLSFKFPFMDASGRMYVGGIGLDITERKRMEDELRRSRDELDLRVKERTAELRAYTVRLEQSNRDLEDFAYVASHDLQEPLRKIQTFSDRLSILNRACFDEKTLQYLKSLQGAAGRMQDLVLDLLRYARVASKAEPFTRFNLKEAAVEAVTDLGVLLEEVGGRVEIGDLPEVEADHVQMRQLLQNLIGNGLKYRSDEKPLVKVYTAPGDGAFSEIRVEDNGIGFDENDLDKIFKPFQRLHKKNSPYPGTGMGLAICRRIVERHGGAITARSTPGNGATFVVRLPKKRKTLEL